MRQLFVKDCPTCGPEAEGIEHGWEHRSEYIVAIGRKTGWLLQVVRAAGEIIRADLFVTKQIVTGRAVRWENDRPLPAWITPGELVYLWPGNSQQMQRDWRRIDPTAIVSVELMKTLIRAWRHANALPLPAQE